MTAEPGDRRRSSALDDAIAVMDRLRGPGGCPWDAEQTHSSLMPYAIEEVYELAEAVESADDDHVREELGDLLFQVLFHARIAAERPGGFTIDDVAAGLVDKLIARHPHVFDGDGEHGLTSQDVLERWDALKTKQQQRDSVLDGIPAQLPALARAQKVLGRLDRAGLDGGDGLPGDGGAAGAGDAAGGGGAADNGGDADGADTDGADTDGAASADGAANAESDSSQIGSDLLAIVRRAQACGVDAESALRDQVRAIETAARRAEQSSGVTGS